MKWVMTAIADVYTIQFFTHKTHLAFCPMLLSCINFLTRPFWCVTAACCNLAVWKWTVAKEVMQIYILLYAQSFFAWWCSIPLKVFSKSGSVSYPLVSQNCVCTMYMPIEQCDSSTTIQSKRKEERKMPIYCIYKFTLGLEPGAAQQASALSWKFENLYK